MSISITNTLFAVLVAACFCTSTLGSCYGACGDIGLTVSDDEFSDDEILTTDIFDQYDFNSTT